MTMFQLPKVSLVSQQGTGTCWCASAMMLHKWQKASGIGRMKNPLSDAGTNERWVKDMDWRSEDNRWLAQTLNMQIQDSIPLEFADLRSYLKDHGPIWTAGLKTFGGESYGHVIVIAGVSDKGVFVYDPEPVKKGSYKWMTWVQICDFMVGETPSVQFLTAN